MIVGNLGTEGARKDLGHVLVACDKFKGTLSAREVAVCITAGVREVAPEVRVVAVPVADGGDGTLAAVEEAGFRLVSTTVDGPTGEPVLSSYAVRRGTAVVELADACGLMRLPGGRLAPLDASSRGIGQMLAAALSDGPRDIVLAVGGSASSDGGAGMMTALGAVLRDSNGRVLSSGGGALVDLETLDLGGLHPGLADARIVLASDVDNPLLGTHGAVAVYGRQKGAVNATADRLEKGLRRWAHCVDSNGPRLCGQPRGGRGWRRWVRRARAPRGADAIRHRVAARSRWVRGQGPGGAARHHGGGVARRADASG